MKGGTAMITTVIIVLTIVIVAGVFILDHFAIQREKEEQEAARKAREERRAAKEREKELVTVKATAQSGSADSLSNAKKETADGRSVDLRTLGHITFACDAGMGSSAMGAVVLQRKLEAAGLGNVVVQHCAINKISENARYIVCPKEFAIQVADAHRRARIIPIDEFMDAPEYDKIVAEFVAARTNTNAASDQEDYHGGVLLKKNIRMNLPSKDKESVIRDIGGALVECGYVTPKYVDGMVAKEDTFNTCIGNYLAIPHGIESVIGEIKNAGLAIFGYPDGVDWGDGETAKLVIAVASAGDDHVETLGKIAGNCETEEEVEKILKMSVDEIYELFA
jgi:mannitol/fructose-specific phosphotransferase system IIA component/galactitol-specific phosphotransferase system IIB component